VYDCLYLALAQRLSCPLVTADRRLAERAIHLGVSTTLIAPERPCRSPRPTPSMAEPCAI
ncbi:MAG: type II toxin-antitoxin system VapC family toxin, partial [bacterium]